MGMLKRPSRPSATLAVAPGAVPAATWRRVAVGVDVARPVVGKAREDVRVPVARTLDRRQEGTPVGEKVGPFTATVKPFNRSSVLSTSVRNTSA